MGLLGIDTVRLGEGVHYLGSETIPVYSTRKGLLNFYHKFSTRNYLLETNENVTNVA